MNDQGAKVRRTLARLDLPGIETARDFTPLQGGVSSDIWRITLADGPICVKCALPQLKVAADWRVPVGRSRYEVDWLQTVAAIEPRMVPKVLAYNPEDGLFAMEYLDPADFPQWKGQLIAGQVDADFAAEVGRRLVAVHAATSGDETIASRFDSAAIFHAIRLEPYLEAAARRYDTVAEALLELVRVTDGTRRALVHGDVSPKNILTGPRGPVFLDAECACYGDPAFDLAFCLNHMLLKGLLLPDRCLDFLACFDAMVGAYFAGVDWEDTTVLETRVARLLPGLLLARVDGKSPVEYLTETDQKDCVRQVAIPLLLSPPSRLSEVTAAWADAVAHHSGAAA